MSQLNGPPFAFERHGKVAVLTLSREVERMTEYDAEKAAAPLLDAVRKDPVTGLVIDLSGVDWVGSFMLATLFRFYTRVVEHRGDDWPDDRPGRTRCVIAGPSAKARELLEMTGLGTLWPAYNTRKDAMAALGGA